MKKLVDISQAKVAKAARITNVVGDIAQGILFFKPVIDPVI